MARTLFSDSHNEPVACICNYSNKPYMFSADSFLGLAEPVIHGPGTGTETVDSCLAYSNEVVVSVQAGRSTGPEPSHLQLQSVPDLTTEFCCSTMSAVPAAEVAGLGPPSSEGLYDHIQCLIDGLPHNLKAEQCADTEAFIKS